MKFIISLIFSLAFLYGSSQTSSSMDFEKYDPKSTLVVPEHIKVKAKYPFIDVHNHQWDMPSQNLTELVKEMDKLNMGTMINLSGRGYKEMNGSFDIQDNNYFLASMNNIRKNYPGRFLLFTNISFYGFGNPGWVEKALRELDQDVKNGASGLKIYKDLGMDFKDINGKRIAVDDARLDPIWKKCGELKIPVIIHSADPKSFWEAEDRFNERWLELKTHPGRKRENNNPAPWSQIINEQHNLFRKHPGTIFIAAHLGWLGNNLAELSKLLDQLPNVYTEFAAVIAELGRQPKAARQFIIKYQDRIMFGKDSWVPEEYRTYFRVLETEDEYFPYHKKYHAFWRMYGLGLPDDILKKIYYKNAMTIIPHIDKSIFPE